MKTSNQFMLLFRFQPNFEYRPTKEDIAEQQQLWGKFIGNIAIQEKLIATERLGFEGKTVASDLQETEGVLISEKLMVSGYMVVKANSLEEAVLMAKDCPILKMNGNVEVRPIIPMEA